MRRFAGQLQIADAKVLDVGCGLGATAFCLAEKGASRVIGIDIDPERILFARSQLSSSFRHLSDRVQFRVVRDIDELDETGFDLVLSQDTFQYVSDPEALVRGSCSA